METFDNTFPYKDRDKKSVTPRKPMFKYSIPLYFNADEYDFSGHHHYRLHRYCPVSSQILSKVLLSKSSLTWPLHSTRHQSAFSSGLWHWWDELLRNLGWPSSMISLETVAQAPCRFHFHLGRWRCLISLAGCILWCKNQFRQWVMGSTEYEF